MARTHAPTHAPLNARSPMAGLRPVDDAGDVQLFALAQTLRRRTRDMGLAGGPILLLVFGRKPQLWLDSNTFVEVDEGLHHYRVIVDNLDTQEVVLDTADLATTVDFALCSIAVAGLRPPETEA